MLTTFDEEVVLDIEDIVWILCHPNSSTAELMFKDHCEAIGITDNLAKIIIKYIDNKIMQRKEQDRQLGIENE